MFIKISIIIHLNKTKDIFSRLSLSNEGPIVALNQSNFALKSVNKKRDLIYY